MRKRHENDLEDIALSKRECRERASRGRRGSLKRKGTLQGQNLQVQGPINFLILSENEPNF